MSKENSADVLVIAASNGENLKLAQRFVDQVQAQGSSADLLDLTTLELPLFTPPREGTRHSERRAAIAATTEGSSAMGDLRTGIQRFNSPGADQRHRLAVGSGR